MALPYKHPNTDALPSQGGKADGCLPYEIEVNNLGEQQAVRFDPPGQKRIRPEMELILACARSELDGRAIDNIRSRVKENMDWDALLLYARKNGVLPLLFSSLSKAGLEAVPEGVQQQLQKLVLLNTRRTLLMTGELIRIVRLLEGNGIAVVPFKGPALAASVYGNVILRSSYDLDILVRQKDVLKAKDLITSNGYEIQPEFAEARRASEVIAKKKDFKLVNPTTGVTIELHWRLAGRGFAFRPNLEELWQRLHGVHIDRAQVQSFSAEDLLMILCVHGSKHLWTHLLWIADIAHVLGAYPELDWDTTVERAKKIGAERMLLLGLFLANKVFDARVPDGVLKKAASDRAVLRLTEGVISKIYAVDSSHLPPSELFILHNQMRERWRDKIYMSLCYLQKYTRSIFTSDRNSSLD